MILIDSLHMGFECGHKKGQCTFCEEGNCKICCQCPKAVENWKGRKRGKRVKIVDSNVRGKRPRNAAQRCVVEEDSMVAQPISIYAEPEEMEIEEQEQEENVLDIYKLLSLLDVSFTKQNMPNMGKLLDPDSIQGIPPSKWKYLTDRFREVIDKVAVIFCPGDPGRLKGSVSHRKIVMKHEKLLTELTKIREQSKRGSVQKRVICATIVHAVRKSGIAQYKATHNVGMGFTTQERAFEDWNSMINGVTIEKETFSQARYDEEIAKKAVLFILKEQNVCVLSWGTRNIRLDPWEHLQFPRITRKKTVKMILEEYETCYPDKKKRISSGPFYEIASRITANDERLLCAVDYVVGTLVNDPVRILERIASDFSHPNEKSDILWKITLAKNFLKVQYDGHAKKCDDCATHGINFALGIPSDSPITRKTDCAACKYPNWVLEQVRSLVRSNVNKHRDLQKKDALMVINEIEKKFELFRGHRMRVANQANHIEKNLKDLEEECKLNKKSTKGHLIVDYKMKFQPLYHRETTSKHFAKRGISWHGVCFIYFQWDEEKQEVIKRQKFIDQILEEDNSQNAVNVVACLEAALFQLHNEFDWLETVYLQSDNAGCYRGHTIIQWILILNQHLPIKIERFIHSETQSGKCIVDAHFAISTAKIKTYVQCTKNDVVTPRDLFVSLKDLGGINNSVVQLLRCNSVWQDQLVTKLSKLSKIMKPKFKRVQ